MIRFAMLSIMVLNCLGCERTWHDRYDWKAEDFFEEPETIQLCKLIEENNLKGIESAIEKGANVNAIGVGGMTPLLWAFPDNKFERFQFLINAGADASICTLSDFNTNGRMKNGTTVAHLAAASPFPKQFLAIVGKGVDPNLRAACFPKEGNLFYAMMYVRPRNENLMNRVQALLHLKPKQSTLNQAVKVALACNEFEIALRLFEAGAEFNSPYGLWGSPVHRVADVELARGSFSQKELMAYDRLVEWLKKKGADLEGAKNDSRRWVSQMGFDLEKSTAIRMIELRERAERENSETDFEMPDSPDVQRTITTSDNRVIVPNGR